MAPKRPRQHSLSQQSRTAFYRLLDGYGWIARSQDEDYGIDMEVETVDEAESVTGTVFKVQLKSTDGDQARVSSVSVDSLKYWVRFDIPVMIVLYVSSSDKLYGKWAHQVPRDEIDPSQQTVTIRFAESDILHGRKLEIEKHLLAIKKFDNRSPLFPLTYSIEGLPGPQGHAERNISSLAFLIDRYSEGMLVREERANGDISITETRNGIVFSIDPDIVELTISDFTLFSTVAETTQSTLVIVAVLMYRLGREATALKLIDAAREDASIFRSPQVQLDVALCLAANGHISKLTSIAFSIADNYDSEQRIRDAILTISIGRLSVNRDEEVQSLISSIADMANSVGCSKFPIHAGVLHYNLGNLLKHVDPDRAIDSFDDAVKFDARYIGRDYWYFEKAECHFLLRQFDKMVDMYREGILVRRNSFGEPDANLKLGLSDALLLSGAFEDAKHEVSRVQPESQTDSDFKEVILACTSLIVDVLGVARHVITDQSAPDSFDYQSLSPEDLVSIVRSNKGLGVYNVYAMVHLSVHLPDLHGAIAWLWLGHYWERFEFFGWGFIALCNIDEIDLAKAVGRQGLMRYEEEFYEWVIGQEAPGGAPHIAILTEIAQAIRLEPATKVLRIHED